MFALVLVSNGTECAAEGLKVSGGAEFVSTLLCEAGCVIAFPDGRGVRSSSCRACCSEPECDAQGSTVGVVESCVGEVGVVRDVVVVLEGSEDVVKLAVG